MQDREFSYPVGKNIPCFADHATVEGDGSSGIAPLYWAMCIAIETRMNVRIDDGPTSSRANGIWIAKTLH